MSTLTINNPFQYLSPEHIDAQTAVDMFVDVFKDYYQVLNVGHTFIHGARGSGKSMMFRIMKPDCQKIMNKCELAELPFYSIYIPIKEVSLNISELSILEKRHGGEILNEHLLCLYFGICIFETLSKDSISEDADTHRDVYEFYQYVISLIEKAGGGKHVDNHIDINSTAPNYFAALRDLCSNLHSDFSVHYLSRLMFSPEYLPYKGALCLYMNFLLPVIKRLREHNFLTKAPIYFLIDDADELNEMQTKILNTWVSYRTTNDVCYKISTQLRYLTFFTTKGSKIDSPHDYSEVTLNQIYTSDSKGKGRYLSNVEDIVKKRLSLCGINVSPRDFFPLNEKQDNAIKVLEQKMRSEKEKEFGGDTKKARDKARDYAYRNARPDYMTKELGNKYTYSYAGFEQLTHLSSGIIRHFLDLAAKMYSTASKTKKDVLFIPVGVQDTEIQKYSDSAFLSEFDKAFSDSSVIQDEEELNTHKKLMNFIEAIGQSFRIILKSNSSERRKFSFYFDGQLPDEIMRVLKLGERYGFFHVSTLGAKSGLGRSRLFVLNRMLAPHYKLDPFSFSGYLYLTPEMIALGMVNTQAFVKKIENKEYVGDEKGADIEQLLLNFSDPNNE